MEHSWNIHGSSRTIHGSFMTMQDHSWIIHVSFMDHSRSFMDHSWIIQDHSWIIQDRSWTNQHHVLDQYSAIPFTMSMTMQPFIQFMHSSHPLICLLVVSFPKLPKAQPFPYHFFPSSATVQLSISPSLHLSLFLITASHFDRSALQFFSLNVTPRFTDSPNSY